MHTLIFNRTYQWYTVLRLGLTPMQGILITLLTAYIVLMDAAIYVLIIITYLQKVYIVM